MITIRYGSTATVVTVERDEGDLAFYVPDCCSRRYLSMRGLGASHASGCPVDRAIREFLDRRGENRAG